LGSCAGTALESLGPEERRVYRLLEVRVTAYLDSRPVCGRETLICARTVARLPYTGRTATVFQVE
jgi:hypothetical protein